jgi:hypothetical protein
MGTGRFLLVVCVPHCSMLLIGWWVACVHASAVGRPRHAPAWLLPPVVVHPCTVDMHGERYLNFGCIDVSVFKVYLNLKNDIFVIPAPN